MRVTINGVDSHAKKDRWRQMYILFWQTKNEDFVDRSVLESLGIERCIFKRISFETDRAHMTKKSHYHTSVEIHIIERGYQIYEIDGLKVRVVAGQFLMISHQVRHVALEEDPYTLKFALAFHIKENGPFNACLSEMQSFAIGNTPLSVKENMQYICTESAERRPFYASLVCGRVWELILMLYRLMGMGDAAITDPFDGQKNDRFLLAKQYIEDNICQHISVPELASYCYISEKQLERIFERESGLTVMEYVRKRKCVQIEQMLSEPSLSLREISEAMHFNNEYHFNSFFKKYAGMTPGAYRKAVVKH